MCGLRIFDRFGFNLPTPTLKEKNSDQIVTDYNEWIFTPQYFDWLNSEHEATLISFRPLRELIDLLKNQVNTLIE